MDYFKILSGKTRSCIQKYEMLKDGDTVAVGLSGGADSMMLFCTLAQLSKYMPVKFNIKAFTVDMKLGNTDYTPCKELCEKYGVEYHIIETEPSESLYKEENPCYLCSKIRRAVLCDIAVLHGCSVLALGHNEDDVAQTLMLNLLYKGEMSAFCPVTQYENISVIRPFVQAPEKLIRQASSQLKINTVKSQCPVDKKTTRQSVKDFLDSVDKESRGVSHRLVNSLCQKEIDGFKK